MVDNPDPRPKRHEHLYIRDFVERAMSQVTSSWTPTPVIAACQICGAEVDLTTVVVPVTARSETMPPVVGWGRWRKT